MKAIKAVLRTSLVVQFDLALPNREDQELFYATPVHAVTAFFEAAQDLASSNSQFSVLQSLSQTVIVRLQILICSTRVFELQ